MLWLPVGPQEEVTRDNLSKWSKLERQVGDWIFGWERTSGNWWWWRRQKGPGGGQDRQWNWRKLDGKEGRTEKGKKKTMLVKIREEWPCC